jgi:reprolysin-like metallo-peptidase family M12B
MLAAAACAACSGPQASEGAGAHDACAPLAVTAAAATPAEQAGVDSALALWRDHGVSAFDAAAMAAPAATLDIEFADAAAAFHGQYDPAGDRVLINRDLTDPGTLAIVIAHELGHAFGLVHIAPSARLSLMNPGNLVTPPTEADQQAVEALWGPCR